MILDSLKDGTPQLRRVADAFGLAPRTLERRLLERFSSILLFLSAKAAHDRREPSLAESSSSAVQEGAQIS
jgi:hypothetical protein